MLGGIFFEGSGLGDQLHRYVTVRTLAEAKGWEWGMLAPENFKGKHFMRLDTGKPIAHSYPTWMEKDVRENGIDIRSYDPEINFVQDNTLIEGSFEDFRYWGHNLSNIDKWLKVEPLPVPKDLCVIGFRGGEYATDPDLFLTREYWNKAIEVMKIKGVSDFQVHTDDPALARQFFPEFEVVDNTQLSHSQHSNMGFNWRSMRYARYAIIANSAFYIMPRNLAHHADPKAVTIAPRFWARRNKQVWARPACYYPSFTYL